MLPVLGALLALASPFAPVSQRECGSYLYQPAFCLDDVRIGATEAYVPQPGDLMLRLDNNRFWRVTHAMALAFDPNGSGIAFARPARGHLPARPVLRHLVQPLHRQAPRRQRLVVSAGALVLVALRDVPAAVTAVAQGIQQSSPPSLPMLTQSDPRGACRGARPVRRR